MRKRHYVMVAGLLIAAWLALFGDNTPANHVVEPVVDDHPRISTLPKTRQSMTSNTAVRATESNQALAEPLILALYPRQDVIHPPPPSSAGSRLFDHQSWIPPQPSSPLVKHPTTPPLVVPVLPIAPANPFIYLGKKLEDDIWEVYLVRGNTTYIAHKGSLLDTNYRIESITPPALIMTYLPLNQSQPLSIGAAE